MIATVQLKRAGDNAPQVLALDVVGQTIWAASTLRFASNVSSMQYKFKAPETREPIYLHLRPHLDVTAARFRVPIQVPSFYTDKLSVSTPAKVATGSEIAVKVKLPQPAESDGVVREALFNLLLLMTYSCRLLPCSSISASRSTPIATTRNVGPTCSELTRWKSKKLPSTFTK